MILATCLYALIAAFGFFMIWAIAKIVWSLVSIADNFQKIARTLDRQRPPF